MVFQSLAVSTGNNFLYAASQRRNESFAAVTRPPHLKKSYPQLSTGQKVCYNTTMPKRTYQPKKLKRARTHGFRERMKRFDGRKVLKRRRQKQRHKLAL